MYPRALLFCCIIICTHLLAVIILFLLGDGRFLTQYSRARRRSVSLQGVEDSRVSELESQVRRLETELASREETAEKRVRKLRQEYDKMKTMFEERFLSPLQSCFLSREERE